MMDAYAKESAVRTINRFNEISSTTASLLPLLCNVSKREGDVGSIEVLEGVVLCDQLQGVAELARAFRSYSPNCFVRI